jgi:hypothetical protein
MVLCPVSGCDVSELEEVLEKAPGCSGCDVSELEEALGEALCL